MLSVTPRIGAASEAAKSQQTPGWCGRERSGGGVEAQTAPERRQHSLSARRMRSGALRLSPKLSLGNAAGGSGRSSAAPSAPAAALPLCAAVQIKSAARTSTARAPAVGCGCDGSLLRNARPSVGAPPLRALRHEHGACQEQRAACLPEPSAAMQSGPANGPLLGCACGHLDAWTGLMLDLVRPARCEMRRRLLPLATARAPREQRTAVRCRATRSASSGASIPNVF
jgi:hypothetical protein